MATYTILLNNGTKLTEEEISIKEILRRHDELCMFLLQIDDKNVIAVDFETGLFYINQIPLNPDYAMEDHKFRLVYYKRSRIEFGINNSHSGEGEQYIHAYLLGWQFTNSEGENFQRIMFYYPKTGIIKIKRKR